MKKMAMICLAAGMALSSMSATAQKDRHDKGVMIEYKNPYWEEIEKSINEFEKKPEKAKLSFKIDPASIDAPKGISDFKYIWHNAPVSQGQTGTCWCFSGTSMLESEIKRLSGKEIKISEMYTVYWQYVEKARRFVTEKGNSHFSEGSQSNAVFAMWKKYGCVPEAAYTGMKPGQTFHAHEKMFNEMESYLKYVKANNFWNEEVVLGTIKSILNSYLGVPPQEILFENKKMTPMEFMTNVTKLNLDEYVDVISLMEYPYWKTTEHKVPDNWWHCADYYNVPLDEYVQSAKNAAKKGYGMVIGGDVSEAGLYSFADIAVVPSFDIPSSYIDEQARQFRYSNGSTGDDHAIHVVGSTERNGETWFLIKDSGSGARNGKAKGYYYFHEDYVKLKMLTFTVHKSAVEDLLKKFK